MKVRVFRQCKNLKLHCVERRTVGPDEGVHMRKAIFGAGVVLLFVGVILIAFYEIPQETKKTYTATVDWSKSSTRLPYKGQTYQMAYVDYISPVNLGDEIVVANDLVQGNGGNWATVFIERWDGSPILTFSTFPMSYPVVVGTSDLPLTSDKGYRVELGVVPTNASKTSEGYVDLRTLGAYSITVNVYSKGLNQIYLLSSVLFLLSGLILAICGAILKSRKSKSQTGDHQIPPQAS